MMIDTFETSEAVWVRETLSRAEINLYDKVGSTMETIRLTMSQALVKFLNAQYVEFDGKREPFIKGIFTIFGHGNVVGIGQALQETQEDSKSIKEEMNRNGSCGNGFCKAKTPETNYRLLFIRWPGLSQYGDSGSNSNSEPNSTSSFAK